MIFEFKNGREKKSKISIKLKNISEHFQCGICQGYIIDATTISECLHSFCKSCIVHFIRNVDHKCPTCNQSIRNISNSIKSDSSLQRLIYQLIPNLLESELERREKFLLNDSFSSQIILSKKTLLNIKLYLEHQNNETKLVKENYLQCEAETPVSIIIKLLRNKFNIPSSYSIKLSYMDHLLNEHETLLELFTCFILSKDDVLDIRYKLVNIQKKMLIKTECQTKLNENVQALSQLKIQANESEATHPSHDIVFNTIPIKTDAYISSISLSSDPLISPQLLSENITDAACNTKNAATTSISIGNENKLSEKIADTKPKKINKDFLKLKWRYKINRSSLTGYSSLNMIPMRKKLSIHCIKKKIKPASELKTLQVEDSRSNQLALKEPNELKQTNEMENTTALERNQVQNQTEVPVNIIVNNEYISETELNETTEKVVTIASEQNKEKMKEEREDKDEYDFGKLLIVEDLNEKTFDNNDTKISVSSGCCLSQTEKVVQAKSDTSINLSENSVQMPLDLSVQKNC